MGERVKIKIDGREYEVEKGKNLLETLLSLGIDVPYFCYHPKLPIAGACRMCIVYVENYKRLLIACNTRVEEGLEVWTKHPLVEENRKYILQSLMTRHPLDCPICDKAGECDLQNYGALYGPQEQLVPISALEKERHFTDWGSEFLEYYSNRCVVCYRCTRVCDYVVGARALYVEERGFHSNIVPTSIPLDTSSCEMCGLCVFVCPVGAIISKPFKFWTRSWLLEREETTCGFCSAGCKVIVEFGKGDWRSKEKVYRIKATEDLQLCVRSFLGYDIFNENRNYQFPESLKLLEGETAFILSPYLSNEVIEEVVRLAKETNAYISAPQSMDAFKVLEIIENRQLNLKEEKFALVGNLSQTAPVISYYLMGKEVYKVGEGDEKLNPKLTSLQELKGLDLPIIISQGGLREDLLKDLRGLRATFIPKDLNTLGLYSLTKEIYSDLEALLKLIEEGKIKNLVIFGEDLIDYLGEGVIDLLKKVENLIVASPFKDGLSQVAKQVIPMSLFGEEDSSFTTPLGQFKVKAFLPWKINTLDFWKSQSFNEGGKVKVIRNGGFKAPSFNLTVNNWILKRSKNLKKLTEVRKNVKV